MNVDDEPVLSVGELLERLPESILLTTPLYIEREDCYVEVIALKTKWIGDRRAFVLVPEEEGEDEDGTT